MGPGTLLSLAKQTFVAKPKYSVEDIPDLSGQVIIVTGANAGIGKETVKALLAHNAKVYIAARSQPKAEEAINDLKTQTGKEALFLKIDLGDLKSVKRAAEEFLSKEKRLNVLFNNGGVMVPPLDQVTTDGYDLQFGTNVLGHFYFTKLLLPTLISTAKSSQDGKARIVNTSSSAHMFSNLNFETFKDGPERRKKTTETFYAQSKFGNIVFSTELSRRYGDQGIVSTSVNPGNIKTDIQRNVSSVQKTLLNLVTYSVPYGALTLLWAGTSPEGAELNGKYLVPWAKVGSAQPDSQDPKTGKDLWEWLEEQVKDV